MAEGGIAQLTDPIAKILGGVHTVHAKDKESGVIGLEFENELNLDKYSFGDFHKWPAVTNWKYHNENSLRYYGFEHVSKPLSIDNYKKHVTFLFDKLRSFLSNAGGKPVKELPFTNSIRTSVHVHFDVNHYSTIDLVNFVCLYWILEPYIQYFCGTWRHGNLFCLRLRDSTYIKILLADLLQTKKSLFKTYLTNESFRYGSVNFGSVSKFGTIEFRMMRGVSSEQDAFIWVDTLEAIRKFALQFKNTNELRNYFLNTIKAKELPKKVLGPLNQYYQKALPSDFNLEQEIREGWLSVAPVLAVNTDWSKNFVEAARKKEQAQSKLNPWFHDPAHHSGASLGQILEDVANPGIVLDSFGNPSHMMPAWWNEPATPVPGTGDQPEEDHYDESWDDQDDFDDPFPEEEDIDPEEALFNVDSEETDPDIT